MKDRTKCVWDAALVFRDPATGEMAGRSGMQGGRLTGDGVVRQWSVKLGGAEIRITTVLRSARLFEYRRHEIEAPEGMEMLEGSYALGTAEAAQFPAVTGIYVAVQPAGPAVALYGISGYRRAFAERQHGTNIRYPDATIASLEAVAGPEMTILECVHYASTRPLPPEEAQRRAQAMASEMKPVGRVTHRSAWGDRAIEAITS